MESSMFFLLASGLVVIIVAVVVAVVSSVVSAVAADTDDDTEQVFIFNTYKSGALLNAPLFASVYILLLK